MRYWFDTEFIEDGKTIDLISIGIVAEDGREYYAINRDCDFSKASQWVRDNVISQLPPKDVNESDPSISPRLKLESRAWKKKDLIAGEVAEFMGADGFCSPIDDVGSNKFLLKVPLLRRFHKTYFKTTYKLNPSAAKPEIWAYYADYDWVVFAQMFGTMMDLPKGFPMYCRDIKQECDRLGNPKLPEQGKGEHNALADARWNKQAWEYLHGVPGFSLPDSAFDRGTIYE